MSSAETLKSLVRHVIEEAARGNLDILQEHPGLHETIPMQRAINEGFSERKVTFLLQFTDGEWVASRIMESHKHTGTFMGIPPTGKPISITVMDILGIAEGKFVEHWGVMDSMAMMQQLGVVPSFN